MDASFRRAQLFINAIKECKSTSAITPLKAYADGIEKELEFIKAEVQKLKPKQEQSGLNWGRQKSPSRGWGSANNAPIPPPEVKK